ncbi:hypothetical protein HPC49_33460 [Pyxidicoccus fallax]|uniref:Uncharacterized protein n=1 Tax=Pyxidicoccus fallax TaxID=394095 RepID=A0A848LMX7_9BACT|nr:hypothetical protein [Pyxidicoccus fallax]NMO18973.1 hypothetical protein [Pyxidicoccus fallax]NPC83117.1 hypothetical protein [Pyxidicoccus fallax]
MGTRSVTVALGLSLLFAGAAGYCYTRSDALQVQGQWLMERGTAQAEEYATRLNATAADAQLKTFAERRAVLERAHRWHRGMMLGVLAAVLSAVCAYMLFLLKRLDDQLVDAMGELRPSSPPEPVSSERAPALVSSAQR